MAQAEQEGRVRSSRRVRRSKRRVAISKGRVRSSRRVRRSKRRVTISKGIVVRSNKSVQVQKKCNEVQRECFPYVLKPFFLNVCTIVLNCANLPAKVEDFFRVVLSFFVCSIWFFRFYIFVTTYNMFLILFDILFRSVASPPNFHGLSHSRFLARFFR